MGDLGERVSVEEPPLCDALSVQFHRARSRARAIYPELFVEDRIFARHLAWAIGWTNDGATLSTLVIEDLYLACACANGVGGAADILITAYRDGLRRIAQRIAGRSSADDIVQEVVFGLLIGSQKSPPEIGTYAGRARLVRWLDVMTRRAALRWVHAEHKIANVAKLAAAETTRGPFTPPEVVLFRHRYGPDLQRALEEVLDAAPPLHRTVLYLYFVGDATVGKIGDTLGVSQSTASRWIARARQDVLAGLKALLSDRLNVSAEDVEALARSLGSRVDLSIEKVLDGTESRDGRAPTS